MNEANLFEPVAHLLADSQRILFITGAGISADSGLPTYRGTGGLYNEGQTEEGLSIEDALSSSVFAVRPEITWKYLSHIGQMCREAAPNAAHQGIAALERQGKYVMVFTQNIDGLHRAAGSGEVVEIHGNLQGVSCTGCSFRGTHKLVDPGNLPPICPRCGEVLRPDVVLFGESLPEGELDRLYDAMEQGFDLVVTIGTSSVFPYIVQPVVWALRNGIPTVEINPAETQLSAHVAHYLPVGAAAAFAQLLAPAT